MTINKTSRSLTISNIHIYASTKNSKIMYLNHKFGSKINTFKFVLFFFLWLKESIIHLFFHFNGYYIHLIFLNSCSLLIFIRFVILMTTNCSNDEQINLPTEILSLDASVVNGRRGVWIFERCNFFHVQCKSIAFLQVHFCLILYNLSFNLFIFN